MTITENEEEKELRGFFEGFKEISDKYFKQKEGEICKGEWKASYGTRTFSRKGKDIRKNDTNSSQ